MSDAACRYLRATQWNRQHRGTSLNTTVRQIQHRIRTASRNDQGFTLVELLIVIVVLGILSGIVVFGVGSFRSDATAAACKADVATVSVAADAFDAKTGAYPSSVEELVKLQYLKTAPGEGSYKFDASTKTVSRDPGC